MSRALLVALAVVLLAASPAVAGVTYNANTDELTTTTYTLPTTGTLWFSIFPNWAQTDGANHDFITIDDGTTNNFFICQHFSGDNGLYCGWVTATVDHRVVVAVGSYTLNQNQWNTLALTWDDAANENKLYLNGTLIGSQNVTLTTWDTSAQTLHLGNGTVVLGTANLDGNIAEFGVLNVVATGAQITDRSNGRLTSCFAGRVNYWPLSSTSDLTDHVGSENLTNSGVTDAGAHPTTLGCGACLFGSGFVSAGCP